VAPGGSDRGPRPLTRTLPHTDHVAVCPEGSNCTAVVPEGSCLAEKQPGEVCEGGEWSFPCAHGWCNNGTCTAYTKKEAGEVCRGQGEGMVCDSFAGLACDDSTNVCVRASATACDVGAWFLTDPCPSRPPKALGESCNDHVECASGICDPNKGCLAGLCGG